MTSASGQEVWRETWEKRNSGGASDLRITWIEAPGVSYQEFGLPEWLIDRIIADRADAQALRTRVEALEGKAALAERARAYSRGYRGMSNEDDDFWDQFDADFDALTGNQEEGAQMAINDGFGPPGKVTKQRLTPCADRDHEWWRKLDGNWWECSKCGDILTPSLTSATGWTRSPESPYAALTPTQGSQ